MLADVVFFCRHCFALVVDVVDIIINPYRFLSLYTQISPQLLNTTYLYRNMNLYQASSKEELELIMEEAEAGLPPESLEEAEVGPDMHAGVHADVSAMPALPSSACNRVSLAAESALQELTDAYALARTYDERVLEPGMISLVETDDDALFVHWKDPWNLTGRPVRLDSMNRVICLVFYMVPVVDYSNARIVIRETTAQMLRVKPALRPVMPDFCLKVQLAERTKKIVGR